MDLWYAVTGSGPPLVLCHGGPGMWDYLGPLAAPLEGTATIVRYDQRGCGRSPGAGPYTVAGFVADLDALRAHLGYERWIVGGHSWGATLALQYALAHPDRAAALVYLSGTGIGRAWHRAYHEEADRRRPPAQQQRLAALAATRDRTAEQEREFRVLSFSSDFAPGSRASELAATLADAPYASNREVNATLNAETKTWREEELAARVTTLTMPALIVHGELDPRPPWAIDSLAAALPDATVRILPGLGHLPWLEDAEATVAPIRAFLAAR